MEKTAVIELDESALKMSIYKECGAKHILALSQSQPISLGLEIQRDALISPLMKNKILDFLKVYRKMIERFGVEKIYAVSTLVITNARNYRGFMDEIYNNTGINFNILTDEDYVKYIFNDVVASIDNAKGVFVHIGAFSTYVVKYNRRTVVEIASIPYGTFNAASADEKLDSVVDRLQKEITKSTNLSAEGDENIKFVGCGNAFLSLGKIAKKIERYPLDIDNNYMVSAQTIDKTFDFIKGLELDKIRKIKGVGYDDADKIAIGFAIIKAICHALGINEIAVTTANLSDGVLNANATALSQERFNDLLSNSLANYYEFTKDEFSINENVHNLAIVLFKQLKVMHKLPRFYVKPLRIAAFMYDCGKCINEKEYSKYGFQKILYSDLKGVSHKELLLASFICLCQDLDNFSLNDWIKYKDILSDDDLDAVRKLGIIVKLAVNLNASRNVEITDVVCDILGDSIIMKTLVEGDASYEISEAMTLAQDYKKVYKKSLQII